jgi:hypothetical protein
MECQHFVYTGCGGNENNFATKELCQSECVSPPSPSNTTQLEQTTPELSDFSPTPPDSPAPLNLNVCSLKKDTGPCLAYLEMFFFNADTNRCEKFVFGGCMGNENRFLTLQQCEETCAAKYVQEASQVCHLPSKMGNCRGYIERFFYNDTAKECQKFVYGGCGGKFLIRFLIIDP